MTKTMQRHLGSLQITHELLQGRPQLHLSSIHQTMLTLHHNLKLNPWRSSSPNTRPKPKPKTSPWPISNSIDNTKIKRQVLTPKDRSKLDLNPDRDFYSYPRLVTHVDNNFIATLKDLYRQRLGPGMEILDLMSSWVSHLPEEVEYQRVVGHGLNAQELAKNPRLEYFVIKDLNLEQEFEFENGSFDAVLCTVSVQYLEQPEKVFAEVARILKPGGIFIVSFSNRMFYEKAISTWRDGTSYSRVQLVVQYFQCVEAFTQPEVIRQVTIKSSSSSIKDDEGPFGWVKKLLGLLSGSRSDPFYAVVAYKSFKPVYE